MLRFAAEIVYKKGGQLRRVNQFFCIVFFLLYFGCTENKKCRNFSILFYFFPLFLYYFIVLFEIFHYFL